VLFPVGLKYFLFPIRKPVVVSHIVV
jgi:hypothetical protein